MIVIIMAGGMGKRMGSDLPKVLHMVSCPYDTNIKLPMLVHVVTRSIQMNPKKILIIVGKFRDVITSTINIYINSGIIKNPELIEYIDQDIPLGTAHAINCTIPHLIPYSSECTLILSGDVPLISPNTLMNLLGESDKLLITELENPFGCGRILVNQNNKITGIREEKDCSDLEKTIKFVNCGIYQIKTQHLIELIPLIGNNNKSQEYYLTDIIELLIQNNISIETIILPKQQQWEIKNVNTQKDLEELNNFIYGMEWNEINKNN